MKTEAQKAAELAMGRIFGMMMRPYREGDEIEYARCKAIVLAGAPQAGNQQDMSHDFGRDYRYILMSGQSS